MQYYLALLAALAPMPGADADSVIYTSLPCGRSLPHDPLARIASVQHGLEFTPGNPGCTPGETATFNVSGTNTADLAALVLMGKLDAAFAGYSLNLDTITKIDNTVIGRVTRRVLLSWKNVSAPMGVALFANVASATATLLFLLCQRPHQYAAAVEFMPSHHKTRFF